MKTPPFSQVLESVPPQPFPSLPEVFLSPSPMDFIPSNPINQLCTGWAGASAGSHQQHRSLSLSPSINLLFLKHLPPSTALLQQPQIN